MLLDQAAFDPSVQKLIRLVCPKNFTELLKTIEACGKSRSSDPGENVAIMHIQVEEPWIWADPEEVATFLAKPSNIQELIHQLTMSAFHLGSSLAESGLHHHLVWPCLCCNTPIDAGHSHEGDIPHARASAKWSQVS